MEIKYRSQLVDLLKHLNLPLVAVEVGVAEGYFSKDLLNAGLDKLYSVDAWETLNQKGDGGFPQDFHDKNYTAAIERLKPFGGKSIILKGLSKDMAKNVPDNSCGLIYLDGDHSYNGVWSDLTCWFYKLVKGGIMATHDYLSPAYGTKQAFQEFVVLTEASSIYAIPENKEEDAGAFFIKK